MSIWLAKVIPILENNKRLRTGLALTEGNPLG